MSSARYVQEAVSNCKAHLLFIYGGSYRLPKKAENPFKMSYYPELDISSELDPRCNILLSNYRKHPKMDC